MISGPPDRTISGASSTDTACDRSVGEPRIRPQSRGPSGGSHQMLGNPVAWLSSNNWPVTSITATSRHRSLALVLVTPTVVYAAVWSSAMSRTGSVIVSTVTTPLMITGDSEFGVSVRTAERLVDGPP